MNGRDSTSDTLKLCDSKAVSAQSCLNSLLVKYCSSMRTFNYNRCFIYSRSCVVRNNERSHFVVDVKNIDSYDHCYNAVCLLVTVVHQRLRGNAQKQTSKNAAETNQGFCVFIRSIF